MAINYQVKQGDCISSIAFEHGFFPETIWDHPSNAELKELREDPNVLMPGDTVFVPDKQLKELNEPTNEVHKYCYKSTPAKFRIQIMENDEPKANVPFTFTVDGNVVSNPGDKTTSTGLVICSIPPNAKKGILEIVEGTEVVEYRLLLGNLDPVEVMTGFKQRLTNLGLYNGPTDNNLDEGTRHSIKAFQALYGLETTGEPDQATRDKLKAIHDDS